MSQYTEPCIDRSATTERALALLLMVDDNEVADGPIIAELASQLREQLARGDVGNECERVLVELAVGKANVAFASY